MFIFNKYFFLNQFYLQFIKLTNKLSIIHPIAITFFIVFLNLNFLKKINFLKKTNLIIFFIFLGSLWSDQELFWGGFWNWDFIEMGSLTIFLFYFFFSHLKKNFFFLKKNQFQIYIVVFFFNYIFSQMSVHKFSKFFLYKYIYIYLFLIIVVFFFFYFSFIFYFFLFFLYNFKNNFNIFFFKKQLLILLFFKLNLILFKFLFFLKKKKHTLTNVIFFFYYFFFNKIFSKNFILNFTLKKKKIFLKINENIFFDFKIKKFNKYYYQLFNYQPVYFFKKYYNFNFNGYLNFL